jgi:hypothetical protein
MDIQENEIIVINWEEIILCLQSYTRLLVSNKKWFRGGKTKTFLAGKEIEDYIYEAIAKYLQNPEKFDSSKGTLINYLKYNIIRSLVSNDLVSSENQTSKDIYTIVDKMDSEDENSNSYLDSILPYAEVYFDQEIDYNEIMASIENKVKGDKILEEIFLGYCSENSKRREVIEEFGMSENDYDNGMRRLKTILKDIITKYNLSRQTI